MQSHELDFKIHGDDIQMVEIGLDPGETVIAEAGAMTYMDPGITFEAKMGDGSKPNQGVMDTLLSIGKRALTGESIFMTHFTNSATARRSVGFAAPYPGKILPMNLQELGGDLLCQKDAFLCAARGTEVTIAFTKRLGAGFFGGEGFILQRLRGDGLAFVHGCGAMIRRELKGETMRLDTGCLLAMSPSLDYSIERAGNLKSMIFGGEGLFLTTVAGHGTVWMQSLPFARLTDRILASAQGVGDKRRGEGSVLGSFGSLFEDS